MTGSVVSAQERVKHRRRHVSWIQNNSSCGAEISSSLLSSSSTVILFHPSTPPNPRCSLRFRVFLLHPTNPDDGELASEWSHWWGSSIRAGDEPCQTPASDAALGRCISHCSTCKAPFPGSQLNAKLSRFEEYGFNGIYQSRIRLISSCGHFSNN